MFITETMTREERRAAIRAIEENRDHLVTIHQANSSPAETVAELIGRIGYEAARKTIAEAVNARGTWDERISASARAWAATITSAADADFLQEHYLTTDAIHPAHVDQIATAAAEYDREKPECDGYDVRRLCWRLLHAISIDDQGRALDACLDAHEAARVHVIRDEQCMKLGKIYDAWERGWVALEEAQAAQEAAQEPQEAPEPEPVEEPAEPEEVAQEAAQEDENREYCRRIAEELEAYADGSGYKCPDCGEVLTWDNDRYDDDENRHTCPHCGSSVDADDLEQLCIYDYFADALDVEYRVGSDKEYRSVRIMVACGGPNIYIDTASRAVELYWWTDRASYLLDSDTCDEIDDWAREYWECL